MPHSYIEKIHDVVGLVHLIVIFCLFYFFVVHYIFLLSTYFLQSWQNLENLTFFNLDFFSIKPCHYYKRWSGLYSNWLNYIYICQLVSFEDKPAWILKTFVSFVVSFCQLLSAFSAHRHLRFITGFIKMNVIVSLIYKHWWILNPDKSWQGNWQKIAYKYWWTLEADKLTKKKKYFLGLQFFYTQQKNSKKKIFLFGVLFVFFLFWKWIFPVPDFFYNAFFSKPV